MTVEIWSIVSSIVSVILGFFAIFISLWFFIIGRKTEGNVSNALVEIKTQTDMLQKISGKQLDRLTKYVTNAKNTAQSDDMISEMLKVIIQIPQTLTSNLNDGSANQQTNEQLLQELVSCYIALYFYSAQTNYWAQIMLPDVTEFDPQNSFDAACKRSVDMSAQDFDIMAGIISRVDLTRLNQNALNHLLEETKSTWKDLVKNSSQVYETRAQPE